MPAPLLIVILHITVGRLVRQRTDGARPVSLSAAKDHFRVFMRLTLILTRKIQIDIRLLVPLEAEKRLERNIKPFLLQGCPTHRAVLVRHIAPGAAAVSPDLLGIKIIVMAFRAQIMGT